jgi:L-ascorbate metabolism protein UlaG (beta-lactamase superfamily)
MDITYLGHSSFKLRGKSASVVTDPFDSEVGFVFPQVSADIVTVSHSHPDHAAAAKVAGTSRRPRPFVVAAPGEYEILGVSVRAIAVFHDDQQGKIRGNNLIMVITVDGVHLVHLGDLGHSLTEAQVEDIGPVDVLMVPVGGVFTIGPQVAASVVENLDPSIVIPMHYRSEKHSQAFKDMFSLPDFLKEMETETKESQEKLTVTAGNLPEETEVIVLNF